MVTRDVISTSTVVLPLTNLFFQLSGVIRETQPHNHEADDCIAIDLKNDLKRKAAEQVGSTSNCEIFREVTRHHQHGAAVFFPFVKRSMLRAKRRIQPMQPHTAEECGNILTSPEAEAVKGNLKAVVRDQDSGHLAITRIFYYQILVTLMGTIREWNFTLLHYYFTSYLHCLAFIKVIHFHLFSF